MPCKLDFQNDVPSCESFQVHYFLSFQPRSTDLTQGHPGQIVLEYAEVNKCVNIIIAKIVVERLGERIGCGDSKLQFDRYNYSKCWNMKNVTGTFAAFL